MCTFFQKYGITKKTSEIDFAIANKINNLYKAAIYKFEDDIRFWIAYMKFCKYVVSNKISWILFFCHMQSTKHKCFTAFSQQYQSNVEQNVASSQR